MFFGLLSLLHNLSQERFFYCVFDQCSFENTWRRGMNKFFSGIGGLFRADSLPEVKVCQHSTCSICGNPFDTGGNKCPGCLLLIKNNVITQSGKFRKQSSWKLTQDQILGTGKKGTPMRTSYITLLTRHG